MSILKQIFCWHDWEKLEPVGSPHTLNLSMDPDLAWFQEHLVKCRKCEAVDVRTFRIPEPDNE